MTTPRPCRTFRHPSHATVASFGDRPMLVKWEAGPAEGSLAVPEEVELHTTYDAIELGDRRIILTPTGEAIERVGIDTEPPAKKAAGARKGARATQGAGPAKTGRAAGSRLSKAAAPPKSARTRKRPGKSA